MGWNGLRVHSRGPLRDLANLSPGQIPSFFREPVSGSARARRSAKQQMPPRVSASPQRVGLWHALAFVVDLVSILAGVRALVLAMPGSPGLEFEGVLSSTTPYNPASVFFGVQALLWAIPSSYTPLMARWYDRHRSLYAWGFLFVVLLVGLGAARTYRGPAISGDALGHYAYLRSLAIDRDLDFANEFTENRDHAALPDTTRKTNNGRVANPWPVGPAILWAPAFSAAHSVALASERWLPDGYSRPYHESIVAASIAYSILGFVLTYLAASSVAGSRWTLVAAMAVLMTTPALYYVVGDPAMPHSLSLFTVGLFLWLWSRWRRTPALHTSIGLGLAGGLCTLVRLQDGVVLLLPFCVLAMSPWPWRQRLQYAASLGCGFIVGLLPQLVVWKQIYGTWLLVPQGQGYLRFFDPSLLELLVSWQGGIATWTPFMVVLLVSVVAVAIRQPSVGLALASFAFAELWVSAAAADWWAGHSFGARRVVSLLPALGISFGAVLEWSSTRLKALLVTTAYLFAIWNALLVDAFRRGDVVPGIPLDLATQVPILLAGTVDSGSDGKRWLLLLTITACAGSYTAPWTHRTRRPGPGNK